MDFVKMEGAGNDYVYVDAIRDPFDVDRASAIARAVADRNFGVGGDGLIVLAPSAVADVRMLMWNADGRRGSMCGNGVRCLAKLAWDHGHVTRPELSVESDAGVKDVVLTFAQPGQVHGARVGMGEVRVSPAPAVADIAGQSWSYHAVDAGNDHAVIFVDQDPRDCPVVEVGAAFQDLAAFADGVNVEFAQVQADGSIVQRTFERGSGETLACGTGATAVACVALDLGQVAGPAVTVHLLGGDLTITRDGPAAIMAGPARTVFSGQIELPINQTD